jgi:hypothetical protein
MAAEELQKQKYWGARAAGTVKEGEVERGRRTENDRRM